LIQAFFSYRSLKEIKRQANIMETQSTAMKEQNDIMVEQGNTMNAQLDFMEKQTRAIQESIEQNERAIEASQRQAKISEDTLEHAKETLSSSECAYIGIDSMKLIEPLETGKYPTIKIVFINGGKTPAWNFVSVMRMIYHSETATSAATQFPIDEAEIIKDRGSFLPSGSKKSVEFPQNQFLLDAERIASISVGVMKLYVIGEARYIDFQNKAQIYKFYTVYAPSKGCFYDCDN
jgi:hypothetical protein